MSISTRGLTSPPDIGATTEGWPKSAEVAIESTGAVSSAELLFFEGEVDVVPGVDLSSRDAFDSASSEGGDCALVGTLNRKKG